MATSLISTVNSQLELAYKKLSQRFRPAKFREIVSINRSIPTWVESFSVETIENFAELNLIGSRQTEFRAGTERKTVVNYPIYTWGLSVEYNDQEIKRAVATGIPLNANRFLANATKVEQHLDKMAALGGAVTEGGTDVGGLLRQAAVTPVAGLTATWSTATATQIVDDLMALADAVDVTSKQTMPATTVILPPSAYRLANRARFTSNEAENALSRFRAEAATVTAVHQWQHAETGGDVGGAFQSTRMCAFNNTPDVAEMHIPEELTEHEVEKFRLVFTVPQSVTAGGVVSSLPEGIAYGDDV